MPTLTAGTHQLRLTLRNNTPDPIAYLLVRGTVGSMLGAVPSAYAVEAKGTVTATLTFSSLQPGTYPVEVEVIDYYGQVILREKLEDVFVELAPILEPQPSNLVMPFLYADRSRYWALQIIAATSPSALYTIYNAYIQDWIRGTVPSQDLGTLDNLYRARLSELLGYVVT